MSSGLTKQEINAIYKMKRFSGYHSYIGKKGSIEMYEDMLERGEIKNNDGRFGLSAYSRLKKLRAKNRL